MHSASSANFRTSAIACPISDHFAKGKQHRYFFCLGRHRRRTDCDQPYVPTHEIEPQVMERWSTVRLTEGRKRELRDWIREVVAANVADPSQQEAARVRLQEIEEERARAGRMAVKGTLPEDLFIKELARIGQETESLQMIIEGDAQLSEGPEVQERMFAMVERLPDAYAQAQPDIERRGLNQAVFAGIWIAGREVRRHRLQPVYEDLFESDLSDPARSNRDYLAAGLGFEPRLSTLQRRACCRYTIRHYDERIISDNARICLPMSVPLRTIMFIWPT